MIGKRGETDDESKTPTENMTQNLEIGPKSFPRVGVLSPSCAGEGERESESHRPEIRCSIAGIFNKPEEGPDCFENDFGTGSPDSQIGGPIHEGGAHTEEGEEDIGETEKDEQSIGDKSASWPLFHGRDDNGNNHD